MYFDETLAAEIFTKEIADACLQGEHGLVGLGLSQLLIKKSAQTISDLLVGQPPCY